MFIIIYNFDLLNRKVGTMDEYIIILRMLLESRDVTQRDVSEALGVSLGKTNQLIHACAEEGYLKEEENLDGGRGRNVSYAVTDRGRKLLEEHRVDAALILASGFGSRFVPLTYETPKGLLEVFGERMVERQIRQLHEVGITDITLMVGYLKEKFDYLIDKYGVKLIYNPEYIDKNTLATLYHAAPVLQGKNCYILSSDNWMRRNMYHTYEPHSWYAATYMTGDTREWAMSVGRNGVIKEVSVGGRDAWCMYGPVYFTREFSERFLPLVASYYRMPGTEQYYWEDVLIRNLKTLPPMYINRQPENQVYEFENLEELRRFDEKYVENSGSAAMRLVSDVFKIPESDIVNIKCLKAGMTNKSWLFSVQASAPNPQYAGKSYICRIPGPGTEKMISRKEEGDVYKAVGTLGITEELIYFNPDNGYKISRYYHGARNADFTKDTELRQCMSLLKTLHNSGVTVSHDFNLRERLNVYEALCLADGHEIPFEDYPEIRMQAEKLMNWLDTLSRPRTICHIDSVSDNFIFTDEGLKMIDWEYCGMADPLIDLGMAAIYSYMNYDEAKHLIGIYREASFQDTMTEADPGIALRGLSDQEAFAIVTAYMGLGGLLWSLWCVYKISLGENFGDYTLKMYRYFKNSYQILQKLGKI